MKKWRNEGRGLEWRDITCKPKPQHHERSYSLGHRGSNVSEEWGLLHPINRDLPSALLSPFQQCRQCMLWVAELVSGPLDTRTPCLTCCCLLPKTVLADELGSSSWRSPTCMGFPETQRSWAISHIPVSLLYVGELIHVLWGGNSSLEQQHNL